MNRKFKLLKELPQCPVGTILTVDCEGAWVHAAGTGFKIPIKVLEDYPEWFEEITELPKSWNDLDKIPGYYLKGSGCVDYTAMSRLKYVFATEAQAKSALAFAQLSQLIKVMNDGWEPTFEDKKHYIVSSNDTCRLHGLIINWTYIIKHLPFKTRELAEFSLKHHRELWEDYWMISK